LSADGAELYKKCAGCHGVNAEKKALGKSQIIKGWDAQKTVAALKGYKDGTYGGAMKALMRGQVAALNDAQIESLAKFIEIQK
jgi:cytochrome c553